MTFAGFIRMPINTNRCLFSTSGTTVVKVDYRAKLLMVKEFLTHNEYMRGGWKKWAR